MEKSWGKIAKSVGTLYITREEYSDQITTDGSSIF